MFVGAIFNRTPEWQHGQVWRGAVPRTLVQSRDFAGATTRADIKPRLPFDAG